MNIRHRPLWVAVMAFVAGISLCPTKAWTEPSLPEEFTLTDTPEQDQYRSAGALFEQQNYPAAAKSYRDFLDRYSRHPRAPQAQMMLAESLYRQALIEAASAESFTDKTFRDARNEYKRALDRIPKGDHLAASAAFRLGEIEFNLKHYDLVLDLMERLQADYPGDVLRGEARLLEAQSLLAVKKAPQAYSILRTALKDQPMYEEEPRMSLAYGISLFEVGNSSETLKYLERLNIPMASFYSARAYLSLGKPLIAIEKLRKTIEADPAGPLVELCRYLIAESFFKAKDYPTATEAYQEFLRAYSRSALRPAAMYKIGLCQYERQDFLAARGSFQSVLQLATDSEFSEPSLYMIAESFLKENRFKEANFSYADMAASYSDDLAGTAQFKQGWTHYKQNELSAAEVALKTMLTKYPGHNLAASAAFLIGNAMTHEERYADAVKAYQRSLDLLEASRLPESRKIEIREACLALLNRANLLGKEYGSLISGYQYVLNHVKPTLNPWRAMTLLYTADGYYRQGLYDQALDIYRETLNSFPASPEAAYAVDGGAWSLFAKGKYALADREREKLSGYLNRPPVAPSKTVLADGKVSDELYVRNTYEVATALYNQKKYLDALDGYEGFEKAHPDNPLASESALQAGWCYYRLEHYGQALKKWEEVQTAYANTPAAQKAIWAIADTYFRAGQYENAIATYERIVQNFPQDTAVNHARMRIAQSYYNARDVAKAISAFESLLREAPDSPEASQVLDFVTQLLYQPEAKGPAMESLTRIADSEARSATATKARFRIARFLYESGDYNGAVDNLEKIVVDISGQEELMDAQFYLAESYYQLKRYQDAALAYERFTANYPGDKRFVSALFHLGASRFKIEDFAGAAEAFHHLSTDYPESNYAPVATFNSALAYRKLGKWEEASLALKSYMKKYPEDAKTSNAVGELAAIYEEHRQFPLLVELLNENREPLPADDLRRLELTERLGEAYAAMGDDDKASHEYLAAAKSPFRNNPFRLSALAKLGEYYEKVEQWAPALEVYKDLAQNATQKEWVEAAKARALAVREKLGKPSEAEAAPSEAVDAPASTPRAHKKKGGSE